MPLFLLSFARAAVTWEKGQWAYRKHWKYGWRKKGSFEGGPTGSQGLQGLRKRGFKEGCQFFWLPGKCCDHSLTQGTHEKHQVGEDFSCGHVNFRCLWNFLWSGKLMCIWREIMEQETISTYFFPPGLQHTF